MPCVESIGHKMEVVQVVNCRIPTLSRGIGARFTCEVFVRTLERRDGGDFGVRKYGVAAPVHICAVVDSVHQPVLHDEKVVGIAVASRENFDWPTNECLRLV